MKKIFPALILAAVSLITFSCIADKDIDDGGMPIKQGAAQVVLRLKTPDGFSQVKNRALTYEQENTINDIFVLVFDKTNTLVAIEQGANVTSSSGHTNPAYSGEGSFSVTLEASKTTVDTYNLVVLANAQTILTNTIGFDVSQISNKSYTIVMTSIQGQLSGPMYSSGGTIPMWGESGQVVIEPGTTNRTLQLTRSVARIDVGVGRPTKSSSTDAWTWDGKDAASATIPFELAHVYVMKPNNRYAVAPDASKAVGEPTVPAGTTAFSLAASETNFGFAATASATGGYTSRDIYVPEANIVMGGAGTLGDENHTNRMALVVGGYFNGSTTETFYRLDFAVNKSLVNVLRNHLYQFNISKVTGGGYPDPETAYNSQAMNMAVDIYEWDETDMGEIVFDGQYYLSVSKGEFEFTRESRNASSNDNTLFVETDVPTGWQATIWNDQAGTVALSNDQTTGNPWLRVSSTSASAGRTTVILSMDANTGLTERTAYIHIASGRLIYKVKVTQTLKTQFALYILPNVEEIVFPSGLYALDPIVPQQFVLNWYANSANYYIRPVQNGGLQGLSGLPTSAPQTLAGNSHNFTVTPADFTANEVDPVTGNRFLEKVSRLEVTAENGEGGLLMKTIILRQKNYAIVVTASPAYQLMGELQTIKVYANAPWMAEIEAGGTAIDEGGLTVLSGMGDPINGEPVSFRMINGNASTISGKSTIIFKPLNHTYFETLSVDINGQFGYVFEYGGHYYLMNTSDNAVGLRWGGVYVNTPPNPCPSGWSLPATAMHSAMVAASGQTFGNHWSNSGPYYSHSQDNLPFGRQRVYYQTLLNGTAGLAYWYYDLRYDGQGAGGGNVGAANVRCVKLLE